MPVGIRRSLSVGVVSLCTLVGGLVFASASALAVAPETPELVVEQPVHATEATLHGVLNPKAIAPSEAGSYEFRYKKGSICTGESKAPIPPGMALGIEQEPVSETLAGLTSNTEYTVCLVVRNSELVPAETVSAPVVFTTAIPPETPIDLKAEPITATEATLRGVLNPKEAGDAGTYEFVYRLSETSPSECQGFGETATPAELSTGVTGEPAEAEVTGLTPNTTYVLCLRAHNEAGEESALSMPVTFTTPPLAPSITSESSTVVGATEARLEAEINPGNAETAYHFEYGTAAGSYDVSVPVVGAHIPASLTPHNVSAVATGLQPGTTYHYRVVASNALPGEADGPDQMFTTPTAQSNGSSSSCPNEQRRAEQSYGLTLPDCRAYEMVSPVETNGNDATDSFVFWEPVRRSLVKRSRMRPGEISLIPQAPDSRISSFLGVARKAGRRRRSHLCAPVAAD